MSESTGPGGFWAELETEDGAAVVTLRGALDAASLPALQRVVVSALDFRPPELTLDMSRVTSLDQDGVGGLMSAATMAADSGCRVTVRGPSESATHVLRLVDVNDALRIDRTTI